MLFLGWIQDNAVWDQELDQELNQQLSGTEDDSSSYDEGSDLPLTQEPVETGDSDEEEAVDFEQHDDGDENDDDCDSDEEEDSDDDEEEDGSFGQRAVTLDDVCVMDDKTLRAVLCKAQDALELSTTNFKEIRKEGNRRGKALRDIRRDGRLASVTRR